MSSYDQPNRPPDDDSKIIALFEQHAVAVEEGRPDDANAAALEAMSAVAEFIEANPDPDFLRSAMADRAEAEDNYGEARRLHQEELDELNHSEVVTNQDMKRARAYLQLARIDRCEGRHDDAFEKASIALEIARELDFPYYRGTVLEQVAHYGTLVSRFEDAIAATNEGLATLEDKRTHDLLRAMLLLRRAEAFLSADNAVECRASLDESWRVLEMASKGFSGAGVKARVADAWRLEAKLHHMQANWPAACVAWEKVVSCYRESVAFWGGTEWHFNVALADALGEFADAAEAAGESQRAASLKAERESILSQHRSPDPQVGTSG